MARKKEKISIGALQFHASESQASTEVFAEGDKKPRLNMVAYSGKIIKNHFWWGDLAIDLEGMAFPKSKYPILESHDYDKKIAFTGKPVISDDFKLTMNPDKTVFVDTPESKEFQSLSSQGFPYEASISVRPSNIERLEEGAVAKVNGYTMKGPGTIFRKTEFREASICVFGYDRQTKSDTFAEEELQFEEGVIRPVKLETDNTNGKEVNEMPKEITSLEMLSEEYPDLVKKVQEALRVELEAAFATERKAFEVKLAAKDKEITGQSDRILKLEKSDTIRSENEMKLSADNIWTKKLGESDIPEHLFEKVQGQVSYSRFVKDEVFDHGKFTEAVVAEIKDWEDKGIKTSVLGSGFTSKEGEESGTETQLEKADEDAANELLEAAGQPQEKKK